MENATKKARRGEDGTSGGNGESTRTTDTGNLEKSRAELSVKNGKADVTERIVSPRNCVRPDCVPSEYLEAFRQFLRE